MKIKITYFTNKMEQRPVHLPEYSEKYSVYADGRVYSSARKIVLRTTLRNGYPAVSLCVGNTKKTINVHELVANAFIVPKTAPFINHKNGNKEDNRVENLEWVTPSGNAIHARETGLTKSTGKSVNQFDLEGNLLATYPSIADASRKIGGSADDISKACRGVTDLYRGYFWDFVDKPAPAAQRPEGISLEGYEDYIITRDGRVFSLKVNNFMKPNVQASGYHSIGLRKDGISTSFCVHRVVAMAYIPNPNGYEFVNHLDGNKGNNVVDNLEWVTASMNMQHANLTLDFAHRKKVFQYTMDGTFVAEYESTRDAMIKTKVDNSSIVKVCKGKYPHAGYYKWSYERNEAFSPKPPSKDGGGSGENSEVKVESEGLDNPEQSI